MLQSMIMNVCVQCVFIVTTKCKAMRNIHLEEQDDQETSNLFYLYMFLYFITPIYFRPSFNNKRKIVTTRKKHLHSVKYETNFFKKNYIGQATMLYNHILCNKKSKIGFVLLYAIFFVK